MTVWLPVVSILILQQQPPDDLAHVDLGTGKAVVGCTPSVDAGYWMCPQLSRAPRTVDVAPFDIDRHEVTRGDYAACIASKACTPVDVAATGGDTPTQLPVTGVTFGQAQAYCGWVHKRLPTEDEWEVAARGPDGRTYPWGEEPPFEQPGRFVATDDRLHPVGAFPDGASPFGVLDLAGNAQEWTMDAWRAGGGRACHRVIRGGTVYGGNPREHDHYLFMAGAARSFENPRLSRPQLGFRCVRSPDLRVDTVDDTGDRCFEGKSAAEQRIETEVRQHDANTRNLAQHVLPFLVLAGATTLGWALSTRLGGFADSRWAIDGTATLAGEAAGGLAGFGIATALMGMPHSSGDSMGGMAAGLAQVAFSGIGALAGGTTGLVLAERNWGAPAGAYVLSVGTLIVGLIATGIAFVLVGPAPLDHSTPAWLPYVALGLGAVAAASTGVAAFSAVHP